MKDNTFVESECENVGDKSMFLGGRYVDVRFVMKGFVSKGVRCGKWLGRYMGRLCEREMDSAIDVSGSYGCVVLFVMSDRCYGTGRLISR